MRCGRRLAGLTGAPAKQVDGLIDDPDDESTGGKDDTADDDDFGKRVAAFCAEDRRARISVGGHSFDDEGTINFAAAREVLRGLVLFESGHTVCSVASGEDGAAGASATARAYMASRNRSRAR